MCYLSKLVYKKNVCLVGGSPAIMDTNLGSTIDSFDLVARINKHWPSPSAFRHNLPTEDYMIHNGRRTDIFFHSGHENTGGNIKFLSQLEGLKLIMTKRRRDNNSFVRKVVRWSRKEQIQHIFLDRTLDICREIVGPFEPTTGFISLHALLKMNFNNLLICGFDFYIDSTAHSSHNPRKERDLVIRSCLKRQNLFLSEDVLSSILRDNNLDKGIKNNLVSKHLKLI